jgi:hypothetical protein
MLIIDYGQTSKIVREIRYISVCANKFFIIL